MFHNADLILHIFQYIPFHDHYNWQLQHINKTTQHVMQQESFFQILCLQRATISNSKNWQQLRSMNTMGKPTTTSDNMYHAICKYQILEPNCCYEFSITIDATSTSPDASLIVGIAELDQWDMVQVQNNQHVGKYNGIGLAAGSKLIFNSFDHYSEESTHVPLAPGDTIHVIVDLLLGTIAFAFTGTHCNYKIPAIDIPIKQYVPAVSMSDSQMITIYPKHVSKWLDLNVVEFDKQDDNNEDYLILPPFQRDTYHKNIHMYCKKHWQLQVEKQK